MLLGCTSVGESPRVPLVLLPDGHKNFFQKTNRPVELKILGGVLLSEARSTCVLGLFVLLSASEQGPM